jgi:hypothetical protein
MMGREAVEINCESSWIWRYQVLVVKVPVVVIQDLLDSEGSDIRGG